MKHGFKKTKTYLHFIKYKHIKAHKVSYHKNASEVNKLHINDYNVQKMFS